MKLFTTFTLFVVSTSMLPSRPSFPSEPPQQSLKTRVQSYLDEWRASSTFPGASVGVVLKDGSSFGVVTGVSNRTTSTPMKVDDLLGRDACDSDQFIGAARDGREAAVARAL